MTKNSPVRPDEAGRREAAERAIIANNPYLIRICSSLCRNNGYADELAQYVRIKLWQRYLGGEELEYPRPWIFVVAQRHMFDLVRKANRELASPAGNKVDLDIELNPLRSARVAADFRALLDRLRKLFEDRESFEAYLENSLQDWSDHTVATLSDTSYEAARSARRRIEGAVTERLAALCLIDCPGAYEDRCDIPQRIYVRHGRKESPQLYREVRKHINKCPKCGVHSKDRQPLYNKIRTIPLLLTPPKSVRDWFTNASVPAKAATAACITAGSLTIISLIGLTPAPPPVTPATPAQGRPPAPAPELPAPPAPIEQLPVPPTNRPKSTDPDVRPNVERTDPPAAATPTAGTSPPPDGNSRATAPATPGSRDDRAPVVASRWIERRFVIAAGTHECCDEPKEAEVRVTVDRRAREVEMVLSTAGRTIVQPLNGDHVGTTWRGKIGRFADPHLQGQYALQIHVVDLDGTGSTQPFDTFDIQACRRTGQN